MMAIKSSYVALAIGLFVVAPTMHSPALAADAALNNSAQRKLVWRPVRPDRTEESASKPTDDTSARNATYEQDVFDDLPVPPTRIRLISGNSSTNEATSDPFGDNRKSVQAPKLISDPNRSSAEIIDSLPPPMRDAPPALQIESTPAQREPAELTPPDPLRNGSLKRDSNESK